MAFSNFLFKHIFKLPNDEVVFLGTEKQFRSMIAVVYIDKLWKDLPLRSKIAAVLRLKWAPTAEQINREAMLTFAQIFGAEADYAPQIYRLVQWHQSRRWNLSALTDQDKDKAQGIDSLSMLTRMQIAKISTPYLNLALAERAPQMCVLLHGMIVKIPVISIQYSLDIDSYFAFNAIRKSKHPLCEELISYLYEILFLQYKITDSLLSFLKLTQQITTEKGSSSMMYHEFKAIKEADVTFIYLKASVEKIVVLLGVIYEIKNLEAKKTHKQKLETLTREIPQNIQRIPYFQFVWEYIKSESLDELNKYRTGLLHKKGISDLQPHKYVGIDPKELPLLKIYNVLHEQHAKNTAVTIGVLALLTDKLVKLDPPDISPSDIPQ